MTQLRIVLATAFIAATTLLSGCGSSSSDSNTQTSSAQPAPMMDTSSTQNYRK